MITFKIWTEDDPSKIEVKADSRDVCVFEKTSRTQETYRDVIASFSLEKFYRLAHIAARRLGIINGKECPLKTFEQTYLLDVPRMGGGRADDDDGDDQLDDGDGDDELGSDVEVAEDDDAHVPTRGEASSEK